MLNVGSLVKYNKDGIIIFYNDDLEWRESWTFSYVKTIMILSETVRYGKRMGDQLPIAFVQAILVTHKGKIHKNWIEAFGLELC
jgi:hypothetical protein